MRTKVQNRLMQPRFIEIQQVAEKKKSSYFFNRVAYGICGIHFWPVYEVAANPVSGRIGVTADL